MKRFFKEHSWWLYFIPLALIVIFIIGVNVWGIYDFFRKIWELSRENIWLFILNVLSIPFAIFGGINLFRGWYMVMEEDGKKLGIHKHWQAMLYLVITVLGYVALVHWITQ